MEDEVEKIEEIEEETEEQDPIPEEEESAEQEEAGLPYDLSFLEVEFDDDVMEEIKPKLEEFQVMGFTQEQVEYILIEMLMEEYAEDDEDIPDFKQEINSKLSKEEKLAWKSTGTMLIKKLGKEHAETIKEMMCNPSMFKVLYQLTGKQKNEGKSIGVKEELIPKKTSDDYYDEYMGELKKALGNKKKVMEIKNRWLKEHPELKRKIKV